MKVVHNFKVAYLDPKYKWWISFFYVHLRNKFEFWNVHGIMNTSSLLQSQREARMESWILRVSCKVSEAQRDSH